jgi:hypothetical protein
MKITRFDRSLSRLHRVRPEGGGLNGRALFLFACFSLLPIACATASGTLWLLPATSMQNQQPVERQIPGETEETRSLTAETSDASQTPGKWFSGEDDLESAKERAWEYRPYRVAVWLCLDGAPQLSTVVGNLITELDQRAQLLDPSGWNLHFGESPVQFRTMFLNHLSEPEKCRGFETSPLLGSYDKLMVICFQQHPDSTQIQVRECDLTTLQWGPLQNRSTGDFAQTVTATMDAICQAFMPLTRIDRVDIKGPDTRVYLQVRAAESCVRLVLNEAQEWVAERNSDSPVFIQQQDRFLPVIRHIDRNGKLLKLQPVELTFLTIEKMTDDGQVICEITSGQRAPLAGRRSRTAERFALVIRPTSEPSTLVVRSRERNKAPVNGIKVYSYKPVPREADEKAQTPEYLGKTDWQGRIEIPPHQDGIRMLTLGRGGRGLLRMPIIPGLYPEMVVEIPNDETSLYAEGIFRGFESEILNLIIQRDVLEAEIHALLDKNDLSTANEKLRAYRALESPIDIEFRMSSEKTQLEAVATGGQKRTIENRFQELKGILSKRAGVTKLSELEAKIQVKAKIPGAVENPQTTEE